MPTPKREIERVLKNAQKEQVDGVKSMQKLLRAAQKKVMEELLVNTDPDSFATFHLKRLNREIENILGEYGGKAEAELGRLMNSAWESGTKLVNAPLEAAGLLTLGQFGISKNTLNALKEISVDKIKDISTNTAKLIKDEITIGVLGGKTQQQVANAIGRNLDADLLARGERRASVFARVARRSRNITEFEMGRAFSVAAEESMEEAAEVVPDMEKEWRHSGRPKEPRKTHKTAHKQRVPVKEHFVVGGKKLLHPRAPSNPVEENYGCTCSHVPSHPDWE